MNAISLKNASWTVNGNRATFMARNPGFGIQREDGLVLSSDGVTPAAFRTKRIVEQMVPHAAGFTNHSWIEVSI